MDETQYRNHPVIQRLDPRLIPSDRMIIRRYNPLRHLESMLENGFRAGEADQYETMEGRASPATLEYERENMQIEGYDDYELTSGGEIDFPGGMRNARKQSRHYNYISCWQLGTHETLETWERYANITDGQRRGIAVETTVGQIKKHLQPSERLYMGSVWYQDRDQQKTPILPFYNLYFFKDKQFSEDREFRIIANHGGNWPVNLTAGEEWDDSMLPDDHDKSVQLTGDLDALINRVLIAPDAEEATNSEVHDIVSDSDVDANVVRSQLDSAGSFRSPYDAEIAGQNNQPDAKDEVPTRGRKWITETDAEEWSTVDLAQINRRMDRHPKRTLVEMYRYQEDGPNYGEYGQDHLRYQVKVRRFRGGQNEIFLNQHWNDHTSERIRRVRKAMALSQYRARVTKRFEDQW